MPSKRNKLLFSYLVLSLIALTAGGLFFAIYQGYIVIRTTHTDYQKPISHVEKRTINLYFHKHGKSRKEQVSVLWYANNAQETIRHILNRWLRLLEEENLPYQSVMLQSAICTTTHEAYLSFDRSPFFDTASTAHKLQWLEDLLQTLRTAKTGIGAVYFLSNHAPLDDATLDFALPWPLSGFAQRTKNKKRGNKLERAHKKRRKRTIIIRPTNEGAKPLARTIKKELEQRKMIQVIIDTVSYANQLEAAQKLKEKRADYYVALHAYTSRIKTPRIQLYTYAQTPTDAHKKIAPLSFLPWDQAHLLSITQTDTWINRIHTNDLDIIKNSIACPYGPIKGISIPAIALEVNGTRKETVAEYAHLICECIKKALD